MSRNFWTFTDVNPSLSGEGVSLNLQLARREEERKVPKDDGATAKLSRHTH
jgi:hypothetical protein